MVRPFNTNPCLILMNMTVSWVSLCWESLHVTAPHLRPPGNGAGFVSELCFFFYKASCGWYFLLFYFNNTTIVSTRSSFIQIIQQMSFDWITFVSLFTLFLCLLFKSDNHRKSSDQMKIEREISNLQLLYIENRIGELLLSWKKYQLISWKIVYLTRNSHNKVFKICQR